MMWWAGHLCAVLAVVCLAFGLLVCSATPAREGAPVSVLGLRETLHHTLTDCLPYNSL